MIAKIRKLQARFFFYVHLVVLVATWSLPLATFNYQNCQKSQKCVQRVFRSLPQLPATTKIVQISKRVTWVANYHQLPSATKFVHRESNCLWVISESVQLIGSYLSYLQLHFFANFSKVCTWQLATFSYLELPISTIFRKVCTWQLAT